MEKIRSKKVADLIKSKKERLMRSFCEDLKNKVKSINLKEKQNERTNEKNNNIL